MFEEIMTINPIQQAEMDAYTAIVNCTTEYFHKEMELLSRGIILEYEIFTESRLPKSKNGKPNILVRMWNAVCRFFRWIGNGIKKLLEKIANLFNIGVTKTPSQICEEMNLGKSSNVQEGFFNKSPKMNANKIADAVRPLIVEMKNDTLVIRLTRGFDMSFQPSPKLPIQPNSIPNLKYGNDGGLKYTIPMISNPDYLTELMKITEDIKSAIDDLNDGKEPQMNFNWENALDALLTKLEQDRTQEITVPQIRTFDKSFGKFTKIMSEMNELRTPWDYNSEKYNNSKSYSDTINNLQSTIKVLSTLYEVIPMALNLITNQIDKFALCIDKRYEKSISQPEIFSEFIFKLLSARIPPKYVAYNAYLVTTDEFNGYEGKYEPKWGQSRCVFFPKNKPDIVYKFPMQMWGQKANKNEAQVTNLLKAKKIDTHNLIAAVTKTYQNYMLIEQEKCSDVTVVDVSQDLINKFKVLPDHVPELKKYGFNFEDLSYANFGRNNSGEIVIRDYGMLGKHIVSDGSQEKRDYENAKDYYEKQRNAFGTRIANIVAKGNMDQNDPNRINTMTQSNLDNRIKYKK